MILVLGCLVLCASLASGARWRRVLAFGLGMATLAVPLAWRGGPPLWRFVAALGAGWGLARLWELCRERPARAVPARVWHLLAGFDTRGAVRVPSGLNARLLGSALAFGAVAAGALVLALGARAWCPGSAGVLGRWLWGALFVYFTAEAADRGIRSGYLLLGIRFPPIQRTPLAASDLVDFWGVRWNAVVGGWLRSNVFVPVARRSHAGLGLALTFVVSGVLHAYLVLAAIGASMAAWMGAFFLVQGALVWLERRMGIRRWPAAGRRIWVIWALLVSSPLFVEPMLRVIGPVGGG